MIRSFFHGSMAMALGWSVSIYAGQWDDKCKQAAENSKQQCLAANNDLKAGDVARQQTAGATATAAGPRINANSAALAQNIQAQNQAIAQAKEKCREAKDDCEQKCDQAKQEAQPIAQKQPPDAMSKQAQQDLQQIPPDKQNLCVVPIMGMMGQMGDGQSPLPDQQNQADGTKQASNGGGGMPLPIPIPAGGGSSDSNNTDPATATQAVDCTQSGTAQYSSCNDTYVQKCTASMAGADCASFSQRYCNIPSATPAAAPSTSLMGGQMVTANQPGEGVGTSYCKQAIAYDFCVNHTGRDSCTTCVNYRASQSPGCLANPTLCVADTSPAASRGANSCPVAEPTLSAGASSTTTSAATTTSATNSPSAGGGAILVPSVQSHFSTQSIEPLLPLNKTAARKTSGLTVMSAGAIHGIRSTASATATTTDIAGPYESNLFNLGSETYQSLCAKGRLHCGH